MGYVQFEELWPFAFCLSRTLDHIPVVAFWPGSFKSVHAVGLYIKKIAAGILGDVFLITGSDFAFTDILTLCGGLLPKGKNGNCSCGVL
jgi:hypothetical protein